MAEATRSDPPDAELIRASIEIPERFGALFQRHAKEIHLYVSRRLGTTAADDVMAETFLTAFRRRESYDTARDDARPWLFGIATTLVARQRRGEARAYRALARTGVDPVAESFADEVTARVAAKAEQRELAKALARLRPVDRDVLLLVAWADLGYAEVAEALGIPIGTVRSRLHRARKAVQQALGGADPTAANAALPADPTGEPDRRAHDEHHKEERTDG